LIADTNGRIALRVPRDVITAKRAPYLQHGIPWHRGPMQNLDDYDIIKTFGAEYRGVAGYYLLATDVWRFNRLRWVAETSMLKTLAAKHQSTVTKMAAKHKTTIETCTDYARASRPASNATASSHWSPGSAGYHWYGTRLRSWPTASPPGFPTPARSCSPDS